jgi:hypothetical protein
VLVDAVPGVTRAGVLSDPGIERLSLTETENAARALNVQLKILEARNSDELEDALSATRKDYPRSLVILPHALFALNENESWNCQSRADCRRFFGEGNLRKRATFWLMAPASLNYSGVLVCLQVRS